MKKQPARNRDSIFDRTSWPQIQMQGTLSSGSNSIWSRKKSNRITQELQRSGHLNLMINIVTRVIVQNIYESELYFGQLDHSTEQTICNILTNIIIKQTNPFCTEAFSQNLNSKRPMQPLIWPHQKNILSSSMVLIISSNNTNVFVTFYKFICIIQTKNIKTHQTIL